MRLKLYYSDFIAIIIFILTLSGLFITLNVPLIGYLDEVVASVCFLFICYGLICVRYKKTDLVVLFLCLILFIIGILGNIIYQYRTSVYLISLDVLATFKGVLYYYGFKALNLSKNQVVSIINKTFSLFFIYLIVMFPCALLNLFVNFGMGINSIYGIRAFQFLFHGAGNCSLPFYTIIGCVALKVTIQSKFKKSDILYLILGLSVWSLTLTSRAIGFSVLFIVLACFIFILNKNKNFKIKLWQCILIFIILWLIGYEKFYYYFQNDNTARYNLLYYGFVTLKNCFPFGSGFATYGSSIAAEYYSPLYRLYGFNSIYGLSESNPMFSSDGLWGEILGQFGLFGTICFIVIFTIIFKDMYQRGTNNYSKFASLYIILILILGSIGTKTVMHFVITPLLILMALWQKNLGEEKSNGTFNSIYADI